MTAQSESQPSAESVFVLMREWIDGGGDTLTTVLGVFSSNEKAEQAEKAFDARERSKRQKGTGTCYVNEFVIDETFEFAS